MVTVIFLVSISGCDLLDDEPDIDSLLKDYGDQDNITFFMELQDGESEETTKVTLMFDGNKLQHEITVPEMVVTFYAEYLEETLNTWIYQNEELVEWQTDLPLEDDPYERDPFDFMDMQYFNVSDMKTEWFIFEDGHFTIAEEHEEAFVMYISEDEYDPEVDDIIDLTVELTADEYYLALELIEDGIPVSITIRIYDRNATTVELPENVEETE